MRFVLLLMLAALCGYGAMQIDRLDPDNYVKMYIGSYVIEIKVLGFLLLVLGLVIALYIVIRLFRVLWKSPKIFSNWRGKKVNQQADAALGAGYLALIKGDWKLAEKRLTTKTEHSSLPYINYLAAAQAAQEEGKLEQRDHYLNAAYKQAPKERLAIGLVKAKLHQSAGQLDQALATLNDVADLGAKNSQFTAMLMQTHEQMGDWNAAKALLPAARKQHALPDALLEGIHNDIHSTALHAAADKETTWRSLPRDQKKRLENILVYVKYLAAKGNNVAAEKLIRTTLKSHWSDDLVKLYGTLETDKPAKLRRNVEGWLLARPESAELNLAAGRLAMAEKNFERAKDYLQQAVQLGQLPGAYSLLGAAYEASNESGKALQLYRAGLASLGGDNNARADTLVDSVADESREPQAQLIVAQEDDTTA